MKHKPTRVPTNGPAIVRRFFEEINASGMGLDELSEVSGIPRQTMDNWKRNRPRLDNFEAAVNALGFDLVMQPRDGHGERR